MAIVGYNTVKKICTKRSEDRLYGGLPAAGYAANTRRNGTAEKGRWGNTVTESLVNSVRES